MGTLGRGTVALISFIARARSVIKTPASPPKTNINLVGLVRIHILISGLCPCVSVSYAH